MVLNNINNSDINCYNITNCNCNFISFSIKPVGCIIMTMWKWSHDTNNIFFIRRDSPQFSFTRFLDHTQ